MKQRKNILSIIPQFFLRIEKRIRFVLAALIITLLMLFSTFFFFDKAWIFIPLLCFVVYVLTYFSIVEGIEKVEWLMLFLMPVVVACSFYFFYFLFPIRWLTRIPFIFFFAISIYAVLLTSNIFNVGVEKSLQLYRAAFSVNYFYQTLVVFILANVVLSFKLDFFLNGITLFIIGTGMAIHLFWTISLKLEIISEAIKHGLMVGLILAECAVLCSFVPFKTSIAALIYTAVYYSVAGLTYSHLDQRLFKETIREYGTVLGFVLLISLLSLNW